MDASGADKLILLVQTNQVLYDKSAAEYKVKDALEKGDIWQIGVDIAVNSERTTDLRCRFSFLVSRWRCDRSVRFLVSRFSFLVSRFSFLVSRWRCDRAFIVPLLVLHAYGPWSRFYESSQAMPTSRSYFD